MAHFEIRALVFATDQTATEGKCRLHTSFPIQLPFAFSYIFILYKGSRPKWAIKVFYIKPRSWSPLIATHHMAQSAGPLEAKLPEPQA